jgi:hypothetical protein
MLCPPETAVNRSLTLTGIIARKNLGQIEVTQI